MIEKEIFYLCFDNQAAGRVCKPRKAVLWVEGYPERKKPCKSLVGLLRAYSFSSWSSTDRKNDIRKPTEIYANLRQYIFFDTSKSWVSIT